LAAFPDVAAAAWKKKQLVKWRLPAVMDIRVQFCNLEKFVRGKRRKSSGKQGDQILLKKIPILMTDEILYRHFGLRNTSRTEKELKAHNRNWSTHIHKTPTLSKSRT
jgi:hypothetical protein